MKIISHLSKIEEGELKEGEEWDEGDKANYERSKLTQEDNKPPLQDRRR